MSYPFTRLPTELLHHIIRLVPPRLSFETYKERCSSLRARCSLVDKRWCSVAQQKLRKHVYIEHQSDMDAVLSALDYSAGVGATSGGGLRERVRSLRLGDHELWRRSEIELALYKMSLVPEVWLSGEIGSLLSLQLESGCFGEGRFPSSPVHRVVKSADPFHFDRSH
jgi:hypothetical protein